MEEGEHWRLAGEKELGQGGTINSFFLQPRGRDSQLELPRGPPVLPFAGLQRVMFIQVPPQGSYQFGEVQRLIWEVFHVMLL